jgi:hypothetical protein
LDTVAAIESGNYGLKLTDHDSDEKQDEQDLLDDVGYDGDFALYAAFATSYIPEAHIYDAVLNKNFWEWWLLKAVPEAWHRVTGNSDTITDDG